MRVLIVHDREEMAVAISKVCREVLSDSAEVDIAGSYVESRKFISSNLYDIAVVDLTLPHFPGDKRVSFETAANLLKELMSQDDLNAPGDLIGITREPDALDRIGAEIGSHLMAVIDEMAPSPWSKALGDRLRYIVRSGAARLRSITQHHDYDVCILTALDAEAKPYQELLGLVSDERYPGASRFTFKDKNEKIRRGLLVSIGRAGQSRSASTTQALLNVYRPKYILMSGICGGVRGKVKLGDLIVFNQVFDWDYGKWKTVDKQPVFYSRPEPISIRDSPIYPALRSFTEDASFWLAPLVAGFSGEPGALKKPSIHSVAAASGSAVVGHPSVIAQIRGLNESISAVDMESYGVYAAAQSTNVVRPAFCCIKSVSDYCDGRKSDRYHAFCATLSAGAVLGLLRGYFDFD